MDLIDLKKEVDRTLESKGSREIKVCIPNNKGGMGGTSVTGVNYAGCGIDWDSGKFMIWPVNKMIDMPPDFKESEFQEAVQRVAYLETQLDILIRSVEDKASSLPHRIKSAKQAVEYSRNNPFKKVEPTS